MTTVIVIIIYNDINNCYLKEPCTHDGPCDPQRPRIDCFRNMTTTSDLTKESCCRLGCCWDDTTDEITRVCYRNISKYIILCSFISGLSSLKKLTSMQYTIQSIYLFLIEHLLIRYSCKYPIVQTTLGLLLFRHQLQRIQQ